MISVFFCSFSRAFGKVKIRNLFEGFVEMDRIVCFQVITAFYGNDDSIFG